MKFVSKISDFAYNFTEVVSFDGGETVQDVTVAYDYYPEERNYPHEPDYAEEFDVFVFDAQGNNITYDIPADEFDRLEDEAKLNFADMVADANEY
jgi:hypothetical protein